MADIFVSYSASDRDRVRPLVTALEDQGWSVWWDRHIKPGPSFEREIEKALDEASCVVAVWSEASVQSDWVRTEASEGMARKILLPVIIDDVSPPLAFRYRQSADIRSWYEGTSNEEFTNFLAGVEGFLGQPTLSRDVPPPPVLTERKSTATPKAWYQSPVLWLGLLLSAIAAAGFWLRSPTTPAIPAVAVMAFNQLGNNPGSAYLSDGLAVELINLLSGVKGLNVASRTSTFYFKDKSLSVAEIAETLNVDTLVEGDLRRSNNSISLDIRLVNAATGLVSWASSYTRSETELPNLRYELAEAIATQLTNTSGNIKRPRNRVIPADAYDHYLRGWALLRRPHTETVFTQAEAEFGHAIKVEPKFSGAHAGLCEVYLNRYKQTKQRAVFDQAQSSCELALSYVDGEKDWRVHMALGSLYGVAGRKNEALAQLELGNKLQPGSAEIQRSMGLAYEDLDEPEQAEQFFKAAIRLDPTYWDAYVALGGFQYRQRRYADAVATLRRVLSLVPQLSDALLNLGSAHYMQGDTEAANAVWQQVEAQGDAVPSGELATIFTNQGLQQYYEGNYAEALEFHQKAARLSPSDHRLWGRIAESYRGLGNTEAAKSNYAMAIPLAETQLRTTPNHWETLGLLALYHAFSDQQTETLRYIDSVLGVAANNPTAHYFAAIAHTAINRDEAAFADLRQAVDLGFAIELIAKDPDLQALATRNRAEFDRLMAGSR